MGIGDHHLNPRLVITNRFLLAIGGGHGGLQHCRIGLFFTRYSVILILTLTCGIAVSSRFGLCIFSSFWLTEFGEMRLFTVVRYRLFGLSFRYNTQNKTQEDIKVDKSVEVLRHNGK